MLATFVWRESSTMVLFFAAGSFSKVEEFHAFIFFLAATHNNKWNNGTERSWNRKLKWKYTQFEIELEMLILYRWRLDGSRKHKTRTFFKN